MPPMQKLVAAVSAGILDGRAIVDLNYDEDKLVAVDFNLVATEDSDFVEVASLRRRSNIYRFAIGRNARAGAQRHQRARWRPTRSLARIMVTPAESRCSLGSGGACEAPPPKFDKSRLTKRATTI